MTLYQIPSSHVDWSKNLATRGRGDLMEVERYWPSWTSCCYHTSNKLEGEYTPPSPSKACVTLNLQLEAINLNIC